MSTKLSRHNILSSHLPSTTGWCSIVRPTAVQRRANSYFPKPYKFLGDNGAYDAVPVIVLLVLLDCC